MSLLNRLSAYWTFEDTATPTIDQTGRGNDLVWNLSASVPGYRNLGLYNINSGHRASCPTSSDVMPGVQDSFTIAGWFKPDPTWQGLGSQVMLGKLSSYQIGLRYISLSRSRIYFKCYKDAGSSEVTLDFDGGADDWFFFAAWRDAENGLIYIQVGCDSPASAVFTDDLNQTDIDADNFNFAVGGMSTGGGYEYTAGTIDSLGIWLRVLDTGELDTLCAGAEYPFGVCGAILFGDFEFSNTWYPAEEGIDWSPAVSPLVRAHGGRALNFYEAPRRLLIRGGEIYGPFDHSSLRTRLDNIKAALGAQPQSLSFRPDRYWRDVRVEYFRNPYGPTHYCRIAIDMEVSFLARDPFQYALLDESDTWTGPTTAATRALTGGGQLFALPEFAFTVGGAGAQTIDWTLTNSTTGEAFQLAGDVTGGQVIHVSSLDQTVLIGTTDEIGLFDGEFLTLDKDANTLTITITTGTITSIVTTWKPRYY